MRATRWVAILVTLAAVDAAACDAILGVTDIPPAPDAGTGAGGASSASSGSSSASSSGAVDAGCPILYVSSAGNDANSGCDRAKPMRHITAALDVAEGLPPPYNIEVCAGMYTENDLIVSVPGNLLGGFDCETWERPAGYGYPGFNPVDVTHVFNGTPTEGPTLMLTVPSGPVPLVVDGFTIHGSGQAEDSFAVEFKDGAGTLRNSRILGASPASGETIELSRGIEVLVSSPVGPFIYNNEVVLGVANGTSSNAAIGIHLTGQAARIDTNTIVPNPDGSASSPGGSFGILVEQGSTGALVQETVASGNPIVGNQVTSGYGQPSIGIEISGPVDADIVGNIVQTTASPGVNGASNAYGVAAVWASAVGSPTPPTVRVLGNQLYGGGTSTSSYGDFDGVRMANVQDALIADNLIYGGYHGETIGKPGFARAIRLDGCTAPVIESNTIFTGFADTSLGSRPEALALLGTTTGARIENNILAGSGIGDYGLALQTHCPSQVASFAHNLFIGFNGGTANLITDCVDAGYTAHDVADVANAVSPAAFSGNVIMTATCSAADVDAGACIATAACPFVDGGADSTPCMEALFPRWDAGTGDGYTAWFDKQWTPDGPGVSCAVLRGGVDLADAGDAAVTTDFFDAGRGPQPTIGAVEITDASCD